jgi:hypothetical protein
MSKNNYYVDNRDVTSVETLIDAFGVRGTEYENAVRTALSLQNQAFILYVDYLNRIDLSPLDDAFTFNVETGELVLFSDKPDTLVEALLEMAMFLRGFETLLGSGQEWQIQIAIGAWRQVRKALEANLDLSVETGWRIVAEPESVQRFDMNSFNVIAYMASRANVEVIFPPGASALVIQTYRRLTTIVEAIAFGINLSDNDLFNQRLKRALRWIEASMLPDPEPSPFDDLFGPDGFDARFFEDDDVFSHPG